MKKILLGIFYTALLCPAMAQEEEIPACSFDANTYMPPQLPTAPANSRAITNQSFQALFPFLLNEEEFIKNETKHIITKYNQWIQLSYENKGLSESDYQKLKSLKFRISNVNNCVGMAFKDSIILDKGLIFVMKNFAYSGALLQAGVIDTVIYNYWYDYFINAMYKGDPITFVTGLTFFSSGGFDSLYNTNKNVKDFYSQNYNSWLAYIVLHEASHILLNHSRKFRQRFPGYNNNNLDKWTEEHFLFSRNQELESDAFFMELYTKIMKFDAAPVFSNCCNWFTIREGCYKRNGIELYPTHPATMDRLNALVGKYCSYAELSKQTETDIIALLTNYHDSQVKKVATGQTREVPRLRGERPAGITINFERFMIRDAQLQILFDRKAAKKR